MASTSTKAVLSAHCNVLKACGATQEQTNLRALTRKIFSGDELRGDVDKTLQISKASRDKSTSVLADVVRGLEASVSNYAERMFAWILAESQNFSKGTRRCHSKIC